MQPAVEEKLDVIGEQICRLSNVKMTRKKKSWIQKIFNLKFQMKIKKKKKIFTPVNKINKK